MLAPAGSPSPRGLLPRTHFFGIMNSKRPFDNPAHPPNLARGINPNILEEKGRLLSLVEHVTKTM